MVDNDRIYSPNEICELLGVSRTTLFRWEAEGKIPLPDRDYQGNRHYTSRHIEALLRILIERTIEEEGPDSAREKKQAEYLQLSSLQKFVDSKNRLGLRELAEHEFLFPQTVRRLLQEALKYDPSDDVFKDIIKLVSSKINVE